jgi:hypothetical protein
VPGTISRQLQPGGSPSPGAFWTVTVEP